MNEEQAEKDEEKEELYLVDTWDMDTVEFEIAMVPWRLRWDARKRILTWATDPGYPEEDAGTWSRVLDFIRGEILEKSHTHVQVAEAIYKAFPLDSVLTEKGVELVKEHECYMPKGWKH